MLDIQTLSGMRMLLLVLKHFLLILERLAANFAAVNPQFVVHSLHVFLKISRSTAVVLTLPTTERLRVCVSSEMIIN